MARLLVGPNPPLLTEEGENELQDAHLAHIADLCASGDLIAAGPASGPDGLHGVSIFVCSLDRARELGDRDPSVVAGKYVHEYAVWRAARSMIVPGSGIPPIPPRSIAEVIARAD